MSSGLQDLRFGARLLLRAPAFTLVAVASLALGIGANAAIIGAIDGLLFEPIAAAAPDRLVAIFASDFSGPTYGASSYADAADVGRGTPVLRGVAAAAMVPLSLTVGGRPERVFVETVSPNDFGVLGLFDVEPATPERLTELGVGIAAASAQLLGGLLTGVNPLDATANAGTALLLGAAATVAMWLPVRRALAVDPAQTLRSE